MDHSATARLHFVSSVSPADESAERPARDLAVSADETDEALLEHVRLGEHDALALLFRRHARRVRSVGWRILRNAAEAEDLVQEVFLYVHRKAELFDPSKGSARSWLIQVAYTQSFLRRRELNTDGFYASDTVNGSIESGPLVARGQHVDTSVEAFFGRAGWSRVWDSLTEPQRATLRLHFYEGCTFSEIAEKLGQSYANVRHHYYRGLERLRKHAEDNDLSWP